MSANDLNYFNDMLLGTDLEFAIKFCRDLGFDPLEKFSALTMDYNPKRVIFGRNQAGKIVWISIG